jgi:hypothetical protein
LDLVAIRAFLRFDTGCESEVRTEAEIRGGLINPEQCAALDLIRLGANEPTAEPRLELENRMWCDLHHSFSGHARL